MGCEKSHTDVTPKTLGTTAPQATLEKTTTPPSSEATDKAVIPAPGAVTTTPGPAFLGIKDVGVVQISNGKITTVVADRLPIQAIRQLPTGEILVLGLGGMWIIRDGKTEKLSSNEPHFDQLAVGINGEIWVAGYRGVAKWDHVAWIVEPKSTFNQSRPIAITVTPDKAVWVATPQALYTNHTGQWQLVETPLGDKPFIHSLAQGADGALYLASIKGIYKFAQGVWTATNWQPHKGFMIYYEIFAGTDGTIAGSGAGKLMIASPQRGLHFTKPDTLKIAAKRASVRAIDGAGRIWIATDNGLLVLNNDGALAQHYPASTLPGVDGSLMAVAVVAGGPNLPTAQAPAIGTVTGQIIASGSPVSNIDIELCATPQIMFRESPCSEATLVRTATTGPRGRFVLPNVPVGAYEFAIKSQDDKWRIKIGPQCCTELKNGATFDVGSIQLH